MWDEITYLFHTNIFLILYIIWFQHCFYGDPQPVCKSANWTFWWPSREYHQNWPAVNSCWIQHKVVVLWARGYVIQCASLSHGHFSPNNSWKTPIFHPQDLGVFHEFKVWLKLYLWSCCPGCNIVSTCTIIFRESIVRGCYCLKTVLTTIWLSYFHSCL